MNQSQVWGPAVGGYPPAHGFEAPPPVAERLPEEAAEVRTQPGPVFGVPATVAGAAAVEVIEPPAGFTHESIARAWVEHLKLVARDFSGVLAVLPHGVVRKILAEAGPIVEQLSRGVL